jgi:hypothetical protein
MTQDQAHTAAKALFPKQNIVSVTRYTQPEWRDGGWKGWRVTLAGDSLHWMTATGTHQEHVCCPKQRFVSKSVQRRLALMQKPEVVKR